MKMTIIFKDGNSLDDCMSGLISEFDFVATEETGVFSNGDGLSIYVTDNTLHLDGEDDAVNALFNDNILPSYNDYIVKALVAEHYSSPTPARGNLCEAFRAMRKNGLKQHLLGEALEILKQNGAEIKNPEKAFGLSQLFAQRRIQR